MRKIVSFTLVIVMVFMLSACLAPKVTIVGTWKSEETVLGVVTQTKYTFKEDGTGEISGVLTVPFTYAFVEDKLCITTKVIGIESTDTYTYQFAGKKLTLVGEKETLVLEKTN